MLATVALVDPELTYDLPPGLTASTGLDALTQLIEPFVSSRANPMTDVLCRQGMWRVARSLRLAVESGRNPVAREDMALASLFGGLALTNAGLGAVHGFAAPIGGMFSAPHGAVCAALLPHVMDLNVRALRERAPGGESLRRHDEVARLLTGAAFAASSLRADDWPQWLGPQRDGVWREIGILEKFPAEGPKVRWRAPIGAGYTGPAVANGRVYVMDRQLAQGASNSSNPFARGEIPGTERVLCLKEDDGEILWKHEYDCPYAVSYPAGPRATPTVHDGKV